MNSKTGTVILKKGRESSVKRLHPWVFSGAINDIDSHLADSPWVKVYSSEKEYLGTGYYSEGSIAVRIVTYKDIQPGKDLWKEKIQAAFDLRRRLGFVNCVETNAYRLIFGENDGIPGLVIDIYGKTAVMQAHTPAIFNLRQEFTEVLLSVLGNDLEAVFDKSAESLKIQPAETNSYLYGKPAERCIVENGYSFNVDWEKGQKTGFFLDQRDNRRLLAEYSKGKRILNLFSYSGAFSVYALKSGASFVHSVDSSASAIELAVQNCDLNQVSEKHEAHRADVMEFLSGINREYDMIVLDPPAFAKHMSSRHNALQAYKRLNIAAIKKIASGGLIFTFSCSQVIERNLFNSTIISAAIESGRNVRIIHQLGQAADHPLSAFFPEGEYLKGLVLYVE